MRIPVKTTFLALDSDRIGTPSKRRPAARRQGEGHPHKETVSKGGQDLLDHEAGDGSIPCLVYDPNNGKAKPLELFYNALDERYFAEGGWPVDKPREPPR